MTAHFMCAYSMNDISIDSKVSKLASILTMTLFMIFSISPMHLVIYCTIKDATVGVIYVTI